MLYIWKEVIPNFIRNVILHLVGRERYIYVGERVPAFSFPVCWYEKRESMLTHGNVLLESNSKRYITLRIKFGTTQFNCMCTTSKDLHHHTENFAVSKRTDLGVFGEPLFMFYLCPCNCSTSVRKSFTGCAKICPVDCSHKTTIQQWWALDRARCLSFHYSQSLHIGTLSSANAIAWP